jgi:hypothetical protein
MPNPRCRSLRQRTDLRWFLAILGFFAYLLLLTSERMEVKERSGRIEDLERALQEKKTDVALRQVELERLTGFPAVQRIAEQLDMQPASDRQRILLAMDRSTDPEESPRDLFRFVTDWFTEGIRGGVAEAMPSATGAGDAEGSR